MILFSKSVIVSQSLMSPYFLLSCLAMMSLLRPSHFLCTSSLKKQRCSTTRTRFPLSMCLRLKVLALAASLSTSEGDSFRSIIVNWLSKREHKSAWFSSSSNRWCPSTKIIRSSLVKSSWNVSQVALLKATILISSKGRSLFRKFIVKYWSVTMLDLRSMIRKFSIGCCDTSSASFTGRPMFSEMYTGHISLKRAKFSLIYSLSLFSSWAMLMRSKGTWNSYAYFLAIES